MAPLSQKTYINLQCFLLFISILILYVLNVENTVADMSKLRPPHRQSAWVSRYCYAAPCWKMSPHMVPWCCCSIISCWASPIPIPPMRLGHPRTSCSSWSWWTPLPKLRKWVLRISLGKVSKKESSVSYTKNGKHTWTTFLFEKYELNFRQTKEVSTVGLVNVCHVGFYVVLCVWVWLWGGTDCQLRRIQRLVLELTYI